MNVSFDDGLFAVHNLEPGSPPPRGREVMTYVDIGNHSWHWDFHTTTTTIE